MKSESSSLIASFQKLFPTGKADGDPFSVSLLPKGGGVYQKSSLPAADYVLEVCEEGQDNWSAKVKVTVL